jgi:hypothetical protein
VAERWQPEKADLARLGEHLFYEIQMALALGDVLARGTGPDSGPLRSAHIEAFTIHVRRLIDFFWCESARAGKREAFAADFYDEGDWARMRPERPRALDQALRCTVGWGVAHLTYEPAWVTPQDKQWDVRALTLAFVPVIRRFAETVDPRLLPGVVPEIRWAVEVYERANC